MKMKERQILVIVKRPGEPPELEPLFENTLEAFQRAVGGYIETCTFASDAAIICNEEGRLQRLPYNCTLLGMDLFGTVLIAGVKGGEFASVRGRSIPMLMRLFGK